MSQTKIDDLLERVRNEFIKVSQDANSYRLQNQKDYNFKINQQLTEMQQIRSTVYELELVHRKMKDSYEEEVSRMKLELEAKDRQIQSLLIQQQQLQQKLQMQNLSPLEPQASNNTTISSNQTDNRLSVTNITTNANVASVPPSNIVTNSQPSKSTTTATDITMKTTAHPINPPTTQVGVNSLITHNSNNNDRNNNLQKIESTMIFENNSNNQNGNINTNISKPILPQINDSRNSSKSNTDFFQEPKIGSTVNDSKVEKEEKDTDTSVLNSTDTSDNAKNSQSFVTNVNQTDNQNNNKKKKKNDVLISNDRSNNSKPIPSFLLDLDPTNVSKKWKKVTSEYYILYNPSLPRNIDVDLHISFDHSSVVCCVKFSNDGKFLATGCNRTTQVYNVVTGELVCSLSDDKTLNTHLNQSTITLLNESINNSKKDNNTGDLYIRSLCFSPDGKYLATGAEDNLIRIWDLTQKKICMILKGHKEDIYSLDYFPVGNKLVSGSGDNTVRIWDLATGQCSLTLSTEDGITTVAVSPNMGKYIAAGSLDKSVRVWDSKTGYLVERLDPENELNNGHRDSVYSVVFTRDGKKVVSGSLDRTVKLWNLAHLDNNNVINGTSQCEVTYIGHKDYVLSVATSENDKYILSGSKDRGVIFWNFETGEPLLMLQGHRNSVISIAIANNHPIGGDYFLFATGSGDCKARVWKYKKILD